MPERIAVDPALGWADDKPAEDLPPGFLTTVRDAFNRNGAIARSDAFSPVLGTLLHAPRYLIPNELIGTESYWLYAGDAAVAVVGASSTHKLVTPAGFADHSASTDRQVFSGGVINQRPVLNSPASGPYWWGQDFATPTIMAPLPDWPAGQLCEVMRPFRDYLIAMDITRSGTHFPDLLQWSDAAAPGTVPASWTAGTDSQAGELSVSFNPGALVDGLQLRDRFYVYKETSVYVLQLVGGQFVFNQRPVFATFGALAKGCMIEWRGKHIVLTDGDLVVHDGTNVESIMKDRLRREVFGRLNEDAYRNSYLVHDKRGRKLLICRPRPEETYPREAITVDLDDLSFGHQSLVSDADGGQTPHAVDGLLDFSETTVNETWASKVTTWANDPTRWSDGLVTRIGNATLLADYGSPHLQELGRGIDQDGAAIESLIERTNIKLGDPNRRKLIRRVFPRFYGGDGNDVLVQIGVQNSPTDAVDWSPERVFRIGQDRFVDVDKAGFLVSYRMRTVGAGPWRLPAFEMDFEWLGEF